MERIYRGYPQALWPEQTQPDFQWEDRRRIQDEFEYFRELYPLEAKRLRRVAEEEFDRIDWDRGPMYDEYPDREFIYQVLDRMLARALAEGIAADRDLMQVVMLHELLRRRMYRR